ncbi:MAG: hypothetical protein WCF92_03685 [bacterium]
MQIQWNSVTWYTRAISYLLLFVIFFLGFYFGGRFQDIKQITSSTAIAQVQMPRIYKNTILGFQITFPINWSKVKIQKNNNGADFSLAHNLGGNVKVFSIKRFNKTEWKTAQNSLFPVIEIIQSGDYFYGYSLGQDDEGFVGFPPVVYGSIYQGPYNDVQTKIIPTFILIQIPETK